MIKCEWVFCKHNKRSGMCKCNKDILLRCATITDLIEENIITDESQAVQANCGGVLICENYETMD